MKQPVMKTNTILRRYYIHIWVIMVLADLVLDELTAHFKDVRLKYVFWLLLLIYNYIRIL